MSSFFGGGSSSSGGSPAPSGMSSLGAGLTDMQARKEEMKMQVQQELAVANAQQLINKMNENCFEKCVPKPGPSLSSSEEQCLSRCMTLYMAAYDQVSKSYVARITREKAGQPY